MSRQISTELTSKEKIARNWKKPVVFMYVPCDPPAIFGAHGLPMWFTNSQVVDMAMFASKSANWAKS